MTPSDETDRRDPIGIRMNFDVDRPRGAPRATAPLRLLVVGDFGGHRPDGDPQGLMIRGDVPAALPSQLGASIPVDAENLLGSNPARLAQPCVMRRMSDLSTKSLVDGIDVLRRAQSLRVSVANGTADLASYPDLDRLIAGFAPAAARPAALPPAPAQPPAGDLDRLFSMLDTGEPPPEPAVSGPLASVIGMIAQGVGPKPAMPLKERVSAIDAGIAAQLAAIRAGEAFAAVESAWRGLQLLTRRPGYGEHVRIDLLDCAADTVAETLLRDVVPHELETTEGDGLTAIVVLGRTPPTMDGIHRLAFLAAAAYALHVPVLASLTEDFLAGEDPELAQAWAMLRGDESAAWLAACLGDVVLEAEGRPAPLWGEPAVAVAAMLLAAAARTGWPSELADREAGTVEGFDLHELTLRGTTSVWPLRMPRSLDATAQLAAQGVIALQAQPNRDRIFLGPAPTVAGADAPLAAALCAAWLRAQLQANHGAFAAERDDSRAARAIGALLTDCLAETGPGRDVAVTRAQTPEGAARRFVAEIRTGLPSLRGRRVRVDFEA